MTNRKPPLPPQDLPTSDLDPDSDDWKDPDDDDYDPPDDHETDPVRWDKDHDDD